jgi:1-acyl-sn-glycerol-3-phosphate acyltransferase
VAAVPARDAALTSPGGGLVGRAALAVYDYLVIYLGLAWLGLLCLAWTPVALLVYPLLPRRRGQALGRYIVMALFRGYLASLALSRRFSFDLGALDVLRDQPSLILAPNHPSLLDAVMVISRLPNVACVLKGELMGNVFLGAGARLARYIPNTPVRTMVQQSMRDFGSGSHLLLFPEGTRTVGATVNRFKGSIGLIAQRAQVPVQTVLIETDSKYLGKGWPLFRKPPMPIHYRLTLGRRFAPLPNAHQFMAELERYFADELLAGATIRPAAAIPPGRSALTAPSDCPPP